MFWKLIFGQLFVVSRKNFAHRTYPYISNSKNRRRKRKPKVKLLEATSPIKTINSSNVYDFSYNIFPVWNNKQYGQFFRKRSKTFKYIGLKTFLTLKKATYIFETRLESLSKILQNLTLNDSSTTKIAENKSPNKLRKLSESENHAKKVNKSIKVKHQKSSQETQTESPLKKRRYKFKKLKSKPEDSKKKVLEFPSKCTAEEAKIGEENGELLRGFLRVNPKNPDDSYVSNINSSLPDYRITSLADRNGALDGDEVLLKMKPETEKEDGKKAAVVVYILKKLHPCIAVGTLKLKNQGTYAEFVPRDKRIPVMRIPEVSWPVIYKTNPTACANILFLAKLVEWSKPYVAIGVIIDTIGMTGDLRVETQSILKEFCLDVSPFSAEMLEHLPKSKEISVEEVALREDVRKECVFTIDPLTARDLDDAVSVKELPNGHYEIGVHISDASYYLTEGTSLDEFVSSKATTIYLVDQVYHMLPLDLCLHCSLLPGEDKLAFSVFWEMNEEGEIFDSRFTRTVINSCAQLAYEHAQQMIDDPNKVFKDEKLPRILNGFTAKDLSKTVNILQKIAVNLREARMKNGSLRIDQVKLLFSLNPGTGEPEDFIVYENKEAHRLIEEFMLLANISVAKQISETYPDIAFLRCHEPPKNTMLLETQACLETCGIHIDISSSGSINSGIRKYITDDYQGICRGIVLNHIFAKPMTRARYFCSGTMEDFSHYALSVPIYTHFTSPIRRYADIMVHRLLAASLGYSHKPNWDMDFVTKIAANCNAQKLNAKRAGEASSDLYLAHYIENHQPYVQDCVVVEVRERSFDAIVLQTGSVVRIHLNTCQGKPSWILNSIPLPTPMSEKQGFKKVYKLTILYPKTKTYPEETKIIVEMFTIVKVELKRIPNSNKLEASLLRPIPSIIFKSLKN
ncbi:hypothetical protein ABEB36_014724 [Hypothenemus hampei]|uniref:RNB domain-containing protein n=1 Tax=Hypothenemus hampei TaxID=57062 RepID=A0ABD1E2W2_HYPHA